MRNFEETMKKNNKFPLFWVRSETAMGMSLHQTSLSRAQTSCGCRFSSRTLGVVNASPIQRSRDYVAFFTVLSTPNCMYDLPQHEETKILFPTHCLITSQNSFRSVLHSEMLVRRERKGVIKWINRRGLELRGLEAIHQLRKGPEGERKLNQSDHFVTSSTFTPLGGCWPSRGNYFLSESV